MQREILNTARDPTQRPSDLVRIVMQRAASDCPISDVLRMDAAKAVKAAKLQSESRNSDYFFGLLTSLPHDETQNSIFIIPE